MKLADYKKALKESPLERCFMQNYKRYGISAPIREFKFCESRRWRFDFCWPERKIAVELEGGAWSNGRHTRGSGFIKDLEKYNQAALDGWRVFRFTDALSALIFLRDNLSISGIKK